jgi:hypothetical protein
MHSPSDLGVRSNVSKLAGETGRREGKRNIFIQMDEMFVLEVADPFEHPTGSTSGHDEVMTISRSRQRLVDSSSPCDLAPCHRLGR